MTDLHVHLAALLAPYGPGDEVGGARFVGASTELGMRLTFELSGGRIVHVEVAPREEGARFAASSERLVFGYRSGTSSGGDQLRPGEGKALCTAVAGLARRNEANVLARLAEGAAVARESRHDHARVREVHVRSLLESSDWKGTRYYTVSPYVGCLIGCRFCYAQSRVGMVRRLEGLRAAPWGSYVDARVNAREILAQELASLPSAPIKFCPIVSDPYHGIEARLGITRGCLEVLRDCGREFPTLVLTRSRLVTRDAPLLASLAVAYAGVSIPTADDDVRRHFEPRGATIAERLETLQTLRDHGIRTFAVVQPMLPGPLDALADALAEHVASASLDVLTSIEGAEPDFADPRYVLARDPRWQLERAHALADALTARGVVLWQGELPPELCAPRAAPARPA